MNNNFYLNLKSTTCGGVRNTECRQAIKPFYTVTPLRQKDRYFLIGSIQFGVNRSQQRTEGLTTPLSQLSGRLYYSLKRYRRLTKIFVLCVFLQ